MRGVNVERLHQCLPHETPRPVQSAAFEEIAASDNGALLEIPTGEGKTAIGYAFLRAAQGTGPRFYVTPTKAQVEQVARQHPEGLNVVLGRSEYPCLYYEDRGIPDVSAQASPCYMLKCKHRVNQETGETEEPGATPCPYFQAKFDARRKAANHEIIVCTTAFFLTNRLMVKEWRESEPTATVIDEVHRIASVARSIFEYTVTDYYIRRAILALRDIGSTQIEPLHRFVRVFRSIAKKSPARAQNLLTGEDIQRLLVILEDIDAKALKRETKQAVRDGLLDPDTQRHELKQLENLSHNIPRLIRSLSYSMADGDRSPLNYVVAFYYRQDDPVFKESRRRARYFLTVRSYYVRPSIRKAVGEHVLALSATIGDPNIIQFESGIDKKFWSAPSSFSHENTRVYLPTDTPNLSKKLRRRDDVKKSLRWIAMTAERFAKRGKRSLIVVTSNAEREMLLRQAAGHAPELAIVSYATNGMTARQAAMRFADGEGHALVGTASQYAEGIDLRDGLAPVIFFLRPGYQSPDDPMTQFEERRFTAGQCWALWNWRVMIEALQVRGRNIRSATDVGVCFFISQQFRRLLYPTLPEWLRPAYVGDKTKEGCVRDAMSLLA